MLPQNSQIIHLKLRVIQGLKLAEGGQVHEKFPQLHYLQEARLRFIKKKTQCLLVIIFTGQVSGKTDGEIRFPLLPNPSATNQRHNLTNLVFPVHFTAIKTSRWPEK